MKIVVSVLLIASSIFLAKSTCAQEIKGTYAIKNMETGIYMRIKDANSKNGTPIVAYSPVNWKCVTWDFKNTGGQTYRLTNLFSGKTLQPQHAAVAEGVSLEEQPIATDLSIQQFDFILVEKDVYLIRLRGTELYLTPSDNKGAINANIVLRKKMNGRLQQWTLKEQHPEI